MSSRRRIFREVSSATPDNNFVSVYWDNEWKEFRVVPNGSKKSEDAYFTTEKDDAMASAKAMLEYLDKASAKKHATILMNSCPQFHHV